MCFGGPRTVSGLHHVALISPCGDYLLEHASTSALRIPVPQDALTLPALSTLRSLLSSPPLCCYPPRVVVPSRLPTPAAPSRRPPRATPAPPPWYFDKFPLALPSSVYHPPPVSSVLASTPSDELTLPLSPDAHALVRPTLLPPPARVPSHPSSHPHPTPTPCGAHAQRRLSDWGVDFRQPGRLCHFAYLASSVDGYSRRHGGALPPPDFYTRHTYPVDGPLPTLCASHSSHPFAFGPRPRYLGPRALCSLLGLPPTDPLCLALGLSRPRVALLALGRGVHFLSARCVLHLILSEASSPLAGAPAWSCASAFTGADTFGAALRAAVPGFRLLAASEARRSPPALPSPLPFPSSLLPSLSPPLSCSLSRSLTPPSGVSSTAATLTCPRSPEAHSPLTSWTRAPSLPSPTTSPSGASPASSSRDSTAR